MPCASISPCVLFAFQEASQDKEDVCGDSFEETFIILPQTNQRWLHACMQRWGQWGTYLGHQHQMQTL